jgi:tetratricopeptide (TPR) repeat protein
MNKSGLFAAAVLIAAAFVPCAQGQGVEELIRQGDEYYRTHHLAPGRFEEAIALYEKALALRPNQYELLWKLSQMLQVYGQSLGDERKEQKIAAWEKGVVYGKRAVEVRPDGKEGHFYYMANMGSLAQVKGTLTAVWNFRAIKKELDKTLELDPDYPPALVAKAQYLTELPKVFGGRDEESAMALYRRAVELDPDYRIAYYYMAQIDAKNRRFEEAIAKLREILDWKEPAHYGNWVTIERPAAERLLREILAQKEKERAP